MHEQPTNHISLEKKSRPRCYAKSSTARDTFPPIPGLISCTEVTSWEMETGISCTKCLHLCHCKNRVVISANYLVTAVVALPACECKQRKAGRGLGMSLPQLCDYPLLCKFMQIYECSAGKGFMQRELILYQPPTKCFTRTTFFELT